MQAKLWYRTHVLGEPAEPVVPSGYLTLIPLNGRMFTVLVEATASWKTKGLRCVLSQTRG